MTLRTTAGRLPLRRLTRAAVLVPLAAVLAGAAVRLPALDHPPRLVWDEQWYAPDAEAYLGGTSRPPVHTSFPPPATRIEGEATWDHPPLAKMAMAAGMRFVGGAAGARIAGALMGTLAVFVLYLLALALWRSVWWAGLASLSLALDGASIVHSRIAMLDVYASTFLLAGLLFLVWARTRADSGRPPGLLKRWFGSPYLFGAGVAFGLALASKWIGVLAVALALLLSFRWRRSGAIGVERWQTISAFIALPLFVYVAGYAMFWYQHGPAVGAFLRLQWAMARYHLTAPASAYASASSPLSWPALYKPSVYFVHGGSGSVDALVAVGNIALWWGFLIALPFLAIILMRHRDWRDAFVLAGWAFLYLPWLVASRPQYPFYMVPVVPFMALGIVAALRRVQPSRRRIVGIAYAAAVVVVAAAYLPVWIALPVSNRWFDALQWVPSWQFTWAA